MFKGNSDERTPCNVIGGHFLRMMGVLSSACFKVTVVNGPLSCRDAFSEIQRCPLETGFTVLLYHYPSAATCNVVSNYFFYKNNPFSLHFACYAISNI